MGFATIRFPRPLAVVVIPGEPGLVLILTCDELSPELHGLFHQCIDMGVRDWSGLLRVFAMTSVGLAVAT